jgi:uncharacterized protein RhaS with RHS repeats
VARRDGATGTASVFYYFSDHLKTASIITDSAGVVKAESDYYPWGGELQFVNNDPTTTNLQAKNATPKLASTILEQGIIQMGWDDL